MDGLDDGAAGGTSGSPEESPGLQLSEGAFAGSSESGVVVVELLAVLGLFAVVVVRGAEGALAPWWARSARTRSCRVRHAWTMPCAWAAEPEDLTELLQAATGADRPTENPFF